MYINDFLYLWQYTGTLWLSGKSLWLRVITSARPSNMKTRRKSRKEQEASSQTADEVPHSPAVSIAPSHGFHVPIPEDIPLNSLTELLPDTPLDAPTPEAIVFIYKVLLAQAGDISSITSELEEARSQLTRKDVELDQAVQDRESAVAELEQSVDSARMELKTVTVHRDELQASHNALQSQLASLSSSQTSRSSELDVLRTRVEEVEREKRELVGVVDRLRSDGTQAEGMSDVLWGLFFTYKFKTIRRRNPNTSG